MQNIFNNQYIKIRLIIACYNKACYNNQIIITIMNCKMIHKHFVVDDIEPSEALY